jgi:beta-glucanase (GH16 family)
MYFHKKLNTNKQMKPFLFSVASFVCIATMPPQSQKLVWYDEFDSTGKPDSTKWNYNLGDGCYFSCGWGNNELQYYTNQHENVRVENGLLVIEAISEKIKSSQYSSARIVTKGKASWLYGKFEIRAKLPKGTGTWPAIWMLPTDWKYGGWPASGEIDIMEHVGHDQGVVHSTIHTDAYNHTKNTQVGKQISVDDCSEKFHTYALEWSSDQLRFFVDDTLYQTITRTSTDTFKEWPFDQPFHLILNLAVGGNWGGKKGVNASIWPQRMEVDYVRVYQ